MQERWGGEATVWEKNQVRDTYVLIAIAWLQAAHRKAYEIIRRQQMHQQAEGRRKSQRNLELVMHGLLKPARCLTSMMIITLGERGKILTEKDMKEGNGLKKVSPFVVEVESAFEGQRNHVAYYHAHLGVSSTLGHSRTTAIGEARVQLCSYALLRMAAHSMLTTVSTTSKGAYRTQ